MMLVIILFASFVFLLPVVSQRERLLGTTE